MELRTLTISAFGAETKLENISVRTAHVILPHVLGDVARAASGHTNEFVEEFNIFDTTEDLLRENVRNEWNRFCHYWQDLDNDGETEFYGIRIKWEDED